MTVPNTRAVVATQSKTNSITFQTNDRSRLTFADMQKAVTHARKMGVPKDAEIVQGGKCSFRLEWDDRRNTVQVVL